MKFTDAKNDSEIALKGIKAEIEWHDKAPKAVTLTDVDGRVVRIAKGEYSQLHILIPAPLEYIEVWRVAGRIPGIQDALLEYHERESDAQQRVRDLDKALRVVHELKVEKVRVTEEEAAAHKPPAVRELDESEMSF